MRLNSMQRRTSGWQQGENRESGRSRSLNGCPGCRQLVPEVCISAQRAQTMSLVASGLSGNSRETAVQNRRKWG